VPPRYAGRVLADIVYGARKTMSPQPPGQDALVRSA
jgi:hypothetical protein